MELEIRFFAGFRQYLPEGSDPFIYSADASSKTEVLTILNAYNVPVNKAKTIFVNGRHASLETVLTDGDILSVFPIIAGG